MKKPLKTKSTSFETHFLERWQQIPKNGKHLKMFFYHLYQQEQKLLKHLKNNKKTTLSKDTIQNIINTILQEKEAFIKSLQNDFSKSYLDASIEFLLCLNQLKRHQHNLSTQDQALKLEVNIFTLNNTLPLLSSLDLILVNAQKGNASLFILPAQFKRFSTLLKRVLDTHLVSETFTYIQAKKTDDLLHLTMYQQPLAKKNTIYLATNYCILDQNIVLDQNSLPLLSSRIFLSGQHPLSAQAIFVHQSQLNTVMIQAKTYLSEAFGPSLYHYIDSSYLSQFNNKEQFQAQVHHYKMAKYLGARCFFGDYFDETKLLFQPGILYSDDSETFCLNEPFFAPILQIISYKDINQVFQTIKHIPPSFISSCFSKKKKTQKQFLKISQSLCKKINSWPCPYLNQENYDKQVTHLLYGNTHDYLSHKNIKQAQNTSLRFNFRAIQNHLNNQLNTFKI